MNDVTVCDSPIIILCEMGWSSHGMWERIFHQEYKRRALTWCSYEGLLGWSGKETLFQDHNNARSIYTTRVMGHGI